MDLNKTPNVAAPTGSSKSSNKGGMIAGIIIAVLVALAIAAAIVVFIIYRRRKAQKAAENNPGDIPMTPTAITPNQPTQTADQASYTAIPATLHTNANTTPQDPVPQSTFGQIGFAATSSQSGTSTPLVTGDYRDGFYKSAMNSKGRINDECAYVESKALF